MIYLDFLLNLSKIKKYILLTYGVIVVKMDNFHLFEMILNFLFYAWDVMDGELYKQHCFCFTCTHVLMFCAFCNGFGNNDTSQKIHMFTNRSISSFVCIPYIGASLIHKNPWSCSLPQFWNSVKK